MATDDRDVSVLENLLPEEPDQNDEKVGHNTQISSLALSPSSSPLRLRSFLPSAYLLKCLLFITIASVVLLVVAIPRECQAKAPVGWIDIAPDSDATIFDS
ncbi:hypothetical protein L228DRAFT_265771 [Xylona heveae TC161]|uniref:Uncharacterized protein n=1 Tax=Xylona heveae (strain CBS 132557 / TC161) TaxID=1328760 RepID=A0A165IRX0_XYLHT|nr:hypothetical protein L228DRAFT_265771 [Xylona heveae TC161]KZF25296.1 hypothetical protein L228DRAFT_265771 [Xylona heveae TC161]